MKVYSNKSIGKNSLLKFVLKKDCRVTSARIVSSSYYTLFVDGTVKDFGPERAPKGHARVKEIEIGLERGQELMISCLYYGFPSFDIMEQPFFFGIELYDGNQLVAELSDFDCFKDEALLEETCKYTFQRGLVERYDLSRGKTPLLLSPCSLPALHEGLGQTCAYQEVFASFVEKEKFKGFAGIKERNYLSFETLKDLNTFDIDSLLKGMPSMGLYSYRFDLHAVKSGLLHLKVKSKEKGKHQVFAIFDETLVDGRFYFGRSSCNDFVEIDFDGDFANVYTAVPYCLRHIMVLSKESELDVEVSLIEIQNDRPFVRPLCSFSPELAKIDEAARNSFRQNAFDIYTDCPGRERAPWLCDSLFMGLTEEALLGSRSIEKHFLENFLLAKEEHVPEGMLPMCFPSDHKNGTFLPEWAMFYALELREYVKAADDSELARLAKPSMDALLNYFKGYENEFGLLENLDGWVFLEWSKAIEENRLEGVHFPTNMLYAEMLCDLGELYEDPSLFTRGASLKKTIRELAYKNGYYADNAVRIGGELKTRYENVSEIGQYMAVLFGVETSADFKKKLIREFPLNGGEEKGVARVAPFIGGFLRLFFLLQEKEWERLESEIVSYFLDMAKESDTLWEKKDTTASLNHGFSSSLCYILAKLEDGTKFSK